MARGDSHSRAGSSAIVTVTVLLTDLRGSTGLASRIGTRSRGIERRVASLRLEGALSP